MAARSGRDKRQSNDRVEGQLDGIHITLHARKIASAGRGGPTRAQGQ